MSIIFSIEDLGKLKLKATELERVTFIANNNISTAIEKNLNYSEQYDNNINQN